VRRAQRLALGVVGGLLAAFLLLPLLVLVLGADGTSWLEQLSSPRVFAALRVSLVTTSCTLALTLLLGTPLAWTLASNPGRLSRAVEQGLQLPVVVPPAVAGLALLLAFGRSGPLAASAVAFTPVAVVLAQLFVAAPLFVHGAIAAFRSLDPAMIEVARSMGASPLVVFGRVAIPMAAPALVGAAATSWSRALGEFGATLMFAGNLEGRTQTMPLAVYQALEVDTETARALAALLIGLALVVMGVLVATRRPHEGP
jgi:molybdate transport system permease protein